MEQVSKEREFERFGATQQTFDTITCTHGLHAIVRKYTYHEMHSYALDAIGEYELGEKKVEYEGTLDSICITMTMKSLLHTTDKTLTC